ncbi:unnamed protein product [Ambrosiozyma monospora]|uniref:Unnamed protein product n=1 Tax=Ambrosiozyma monospora TaxID=43982 RepID=A0A9W6YTJ2_AMBMO|nr:unnamed protein product [Ambrosiozyma monospora]
MLSQEYPSVPQTVFDNLFIYENYVANKASQTRRTIRRRFSIHKLFGGVFNDGMKLESKKDSSSEACSEPIGPLPTMKRLKSARTFDDRLSVITEESISETEDDHDEADSDKQYEVTPHNSGNSQSSISDLNEEEEKIPVVCTDTDGRNDLQTCEVAPQGYMDVHEYLKTKIPKSRKVKANDVRIVGYQGPQADSESDSSATTDCECTILPAERSYYPYSALLETIPLPQPETFYDA